MPMPLREEPPAKDTASAISEEAEGWILLQRPSGSREHFRGVMLAEANSYNPNNSGWHELELYSKDDGTFVLRIQMRQKSPDLADTMHIYKAKDMDRVLDILEKYPAKISLGDLMPRKNDGEEAAPAQAALAEANMLQNLEQIRRHYSALAGDFMFALHGL